MNENNKNPEVEKNPEVLGGSNTDPPSYSLSRSFHGTVNNWTQQDLEKIKLLGNWGCVSQEIAPTTGTPHLQWCAYFANKTSKDRIIKKFGNKISVRYSTQSAYVNKNYVLGNCEKKNFQLNPTFEEWGQMPKQGKRTDLEQIKTKIIEGKRVDDLVIEQPVLYHQYGRTLEKIEDIAMRKKFRTEMTKGIWYWGKTGCGKSHQAYEGFNPETHYDLNIQDNGWWEGYSQQPTVIINEFRGEIKFNELLSLVDKWPKTVKRRNRQPMPFISKTVIITSACPPHEIYKHSLTENDKIEQFTRRFKIIHLQDNVEDIIQDIRKLYKK